MTWTIRVATRKNNNLAAPWRACQLSQNLHLCMCLLMMFKRWEHRSLWVFFPNHAMDYWGSKFATIQQVSGCPFWNRQYMAIFLPLWGSQFWDEQVLCSHQPANGCNCHLGLSFFFLGSWGCSRIVPTHNQRSTRILWKKTWEHMIAIINHTHMYIYICI